MKYVMNHEEKVARRKARQQILEAANKVCHYSKFRMSDIQRAARLCRRRGLVNNKVLVAAGFNPSQTKVAVKQVVAPELASMQVEKMGRIRTFMEARCNRRQDPTTKQMRGADPQGHRLGSRRFQRSR